MQTTLNAPCAGIVTTLPMNCAMFVPELDSSRRLLKITVGGHIGPQDAKACLETLPSLLAHLQSGFRVLTDLSGVESMSMDTAPYIGQIMELCSRSGVETVIRVLPAEACREVGFAILSLFHYSREVRIVTCESLVEVEGHLADLNPDS